VTWLNQQSDLLYEHIYGDKDTFLLGWLLTNSAFHLVDQLPKQVPFAICQYDFEGQVLFQHRTQAKWVIYGVNRTVEGFQFEKECLKSLGELRAKWNGKVFHPPTRSDHARDLESVLAKTLLFRLTMIGSTSHDLELMPAHRIGKGSSHHFRYWYIEDDGEDLLLVLEGNNETTARLERHGNGSWRGTMLVDAEMPLLLEVADQSQSEVWSGAQSRPAGGLQDVAAMILDHYSRLPMDLGVGRDFEGALRTLLHLDPDLKNFLDRLMELGSRDAPILQLARRVIQDAALATDDNAREVRRGHNTYTTVSNLDRKYTRSD
jgi:hypothetical protein